MKICIIYHQFNVFGGAQNQILKLAKSLNKRGHSITIVTFDISEYYRNIFKKFADIKIIENPFKKILMKRPFVYLFIIVYNILGKNNFLKNFDLNNPHGYPMHWLCYGFKEKTVWMCNEPPMYHYVNNAKNKLDFAFKNLLKEFFYRFFEVPISKKSISNIAVLDNNRKKVVESIYTINTNVARSGIDTSLFMKIKKKKYDKIKILFVSRLVKNKRIIDFLNVAETISREYKNVEFYVVGSGPLENVVDEYKNRIKNIHHLKNIKNEELVKIYNDSHILIFPAVKQPWGLVALEAMACGCVSIVSKDTGVAEVLTNNKNSILVNPYNPNEIVKHVKYLLDNPEKMKKLAENGYNFVSKNLTMETYVDTMEKIFMRTLKSKK